MFCDQSIKTTDHIIEELAIEVSKAKHQLFKENKVERKVKSVMFDLEKRIAKASEKRSKMKDEIYSVQQEINFLNQKIDLSNEKMHKQRRYLAHRLKAIYKLSDSGLVHLLFSEDINFDKNMKYLNIVVNDDLNVIADYKLNLSALKIQKNKLSTKHQELIAAQSKYKKQEVALEKDQISQNKVLKAIKQAQLSKLKKIQSLRGKLKASSLSVVDRTMKKLLEKTFFELKGKLTPPVKGTVLIDYGIHTDTEYANSIRYKGNLIETDPEENVLTIYSGEVKYSGQMPGYGNIIIIDHGQSYYSVYAHLKKLEVSAGDSVKPQQQIAKTGMINNNKNGVYFELRHFSDPIDPKLWVAQQ